MKTDFKGGRFQKVVVRQQKKGEKRAKKQGKGVSSVPTNSFSNHSIFCRRNIRLELSD